MNIVIPDRRYSDVYFITMSINISIPERKYSYVYFITMFINISIPEGKYSYVYFKHCNKIYIAIFSLRNAYINEHRNKI
jgi:hypothetical protein